MKVLLEYKLFMYCVNHAEKKKKQLQKALSSFIKGKASSQPNNYCPFDYAAWNHQSKDVVSSDIL